jgi:hypothetical protein
VNQELTLRLVKRFPVLYQDYRSPMTQTAMCWGFDHGDGWFEIIWQLSLAIEEELAYSWTRKRWLLFKKSFFRSWNAYNRKRQEAFETHGFEKGLDVLAGVQL